MSAASDYNTKQIALGRLTATHITTLVRHWQESVGLVADGKAGPQTIATLQPKSPSTGLLIDPGDWLSGPGVTAIKAHPSWYGGQLAIGQPQGIVAHYTATDPGTAVNMARRRSKPFDSDPDNRLASWHVTIETDGSVVQMIPLSAVAWHAGSSTAKPIAGLGQANYCTVGIELVGYGKEFPPAQVESAKRVWRAIVQAYGIERRYAMIGHSEIDPTRRGDPGPVWVAEHATAVLDAAYG